MSDNEIENNTTSKKRGRPSKKQKEINEEVKEEIKEEVKEKVAAKNQAVSENQISEKQEFVTEQLLIDKNQLKVIKLALGWNDSNPLTYVKVNGASEKIPVLFSYRNRFFADKSDSLDDLVKKGLMEYTDCGINGMTRKGYKVTEQGIKYLTEVEKIVIKIKPLKNGENWRTAKPKEE